MLLVVCRIHVDSGSYHLIKRFTISAGNNATLRDFESFSVIECTLFFIIH